MPPKPNDVLLAPADAGSSFSSDGPLSAMSSRNRSVSIERRDSFSGFSNLAELSRPRLDSDSLSEGCSDLHDVLGDLNARYAAIQSRAEGPVTTVSPVIDACRVSLRTRMPLVLEQARLLIDSLLASEDDASHIKGQLRSSFAIFRASQYLDMIEMAMQDPPRSDLDERLMTVLKSPKLEQLRTLLDDALCFRVSPWVPSSLAFDLPAGVSTRVALPGDDKSPPLNLEVEPVFEFHAEDIIHGRDILSSFRACKVEIEKCKHEPKKFSSGAGTVGECTLRVRLSPLDAENEGLRVWGVEPEVEKIYVKEARAIQLNAYPPQPKANVDLYKSYVYGDPGVTITMVIKTMSTAAKEIPKLHIELFLALSQDV